MGGKAEVLAFMRHQGLPLASWFLSAKPKRAQYRKRMQTLVHSLTADLEQDPATSWRTRAGSTANIFWGLQPAAVRGRAGTRRRLPPTPLGSRYPRGVDSPKSPKTRKGMPRNRKGLGCFF